MTVLETKEQLTPPTDGGIFLSEKEVEDTLQLIERVESAPEADNYKSAAVSLMRQKTGKYIPRVIKHIEASDQEIVQIGGNVYGIGSFSSLPPYLVKLEQDGQLVHFVDAGLPNYETDRNAGMRDEMRFLLDLLEVEASQA